MENSVYCINLEEIYTHSCSPNLHGLNDSMEFRNTSNEMQFSFAEWRILTPTVLKETMMRIPWATHRRPGGQTTVIGATVKDERAPDGIISTPWSGGQTTIGGIQTQEHANDAVSWPYQPVGCKQEMENSWVDRKLGDAIVENDPKDKSSTRKLRQKTGDAVLKNSHDCLDVGHVSSFQAPSSEVTNSCEGHPRGFNDCIPVARQHI